MAKRKEEHKEKGQWIEGRAKKEKSSKGEWVEGGVKGGGETGC